MFHQHENPLPHTSFKSDWTWRKSNKFIGNHYHRRRSIRSNTNYVQKVSALNRATRTAMNYGCSRTTSSFKMTYINDDNKFCCWRCKFENPRMHEFTYTSNELKLHLGITDSNHLYDISPEPFHEEFTTISCFLMLDYENNVRVYSYRFLYYNPRCHISAEDVTNITSLNEVHYKKVLVMVGNRRNARFFQLNSIRTVPTLSMWI